MFSYLCDTSSLLTAFFKYKEVLNDNIWNVYG